MEEQEARQRLALAAALSEAARDLCEGGGPAEVLGRLSDRIRTLRSVQKQDVKKSPLPQSEGSSLALVPTLVHEQASLQTSSACEAPLQAVALASPDPSTAIVRRVFRYWQDKLDHPAAKATPERVAKIRQRLRDGYSETDLLAAIRGCASSPFNVGENPSGTRYDDLTLILRNGSMLEKFRDRAPEEEAIASAPTPLTPEDQAYRDETGRMDRQAKAALKAGDVEAYNDLLRSIRARRSNPG